MEEISEYGKWWKNEGIEPGQMLHFKFAVKPEGKSRKSGDIYMFVTRITAAGPVGVTFIGYENGNSITEWTECPDGDDVTEHAYDRMSCEKDPRYIPLALYKTVKDLTDTDKERYSDMLRYICCVDRLTLPMTQNNVSAYLEKNPLKPDMYAYVEFMYYRRGAVMFMPVPVRLVRFPNGSMFIYKPQETAYEWTICVNDSYWKNITKHTKEYHVSRFECRDGRLPDGLAKCMNESVRKMEDRAHVLRHQADKLEGLADIIKNQIIYHG